MKFIQYNGKERNLKVDETQWDSLTQTRIYYTPRGTQYEVTNGNVYRIHPCSGKRTKIGFIE